VIPSIILAGVNAYRLWTEHWEHVAHGPALEDKPEYPFQNIRTKNYFWGDGDKVRAFGLNGALHLSLPLASANTLRRPSSGTPRSTTTRRSREEVLFET
jgi:hypothetical protein